MVAENEEEASQGNVARIVFVKAEAVIVICQGWCIAIYTANHLIDNVLAHPCMFFPVRALISGFSLSGRPLGCNRVLIPDWRRIFLL